MGIREELFGMAVVASGVCSSKLMLGGRSRLMRLPAVHGIIAPKKPWLASDGSHVYVRNLKLCNLGAWLGSLAVIK